MQVFPRRYSPPLWQLVTIAHVATPVGGKNTIPCAVALSRHEPRCGNTVGYRERGHPRMGRHRDLLRASSARFYCLCSSSQECEVSVACRSQVGCPVGRASDSRWCEGDLASPDDRLFDLLRPPTPVTPECDGGSLAGKLSATVSSSRRSCPSLLLCRRGCVIGSSSFPGAAASGTGSSLAIPRHLSAADRDASTAAVLRATVSRSINGDLVHHPRATRLDPVSCSLRGAARRATRPVVSSQGGFVPPSSRDRQRTQPASCASPGLDAP